MASGVVHWAIEVPEHDPRHRCGGHAGAVLPQAAHGVHCRRHCLRQRSWRVSLDNFRQVWADQPWLHFYRNGVAATELIFVGRGTAMLLVAACRRRATRHESPEPSRPTSCHRPRSPLPCRPCKRSADKDRQSHDTLISMSSPAAPVFSSSGTTNTGAPSTSSTRQVTRRRPIAGQIPQVWAGLDQQNRACLTTGSQNAASRS